MKINAFKKILTFQQSTSMDKGESELLDVTIGAYDGAEVYELVGSFLLYQLSDKYNKKDIGLYRDDGLEVFKNKGGPQAERIKKDFQKFFQENDLNIVIKCNLKIVDYLDATLNLVNNTYKLFSKPNNEVNYICYGKCDKIGNYAYFPAVQLGNLTKNESFIKFSGYFA